MSHPEHPKSVVIKVYINRLNGTTSIHRVRGVFDFEQLLAMVNRFVCTPVALLASETSAATPSTPSAVQPQCAPLKMEYDDEDGDCVCVSCGLEWIECLAQYDAACSSSNTNEPLKLHVKQLGEPVAMAVVAPVAVAALPPSVVCEEPTSTATDAPLVVVDNAELDDAKVEGSHDHSGGDETPRTPLPDFSYDPDNDDDEGASGNHVRAIVAGKSHYTLEPQLHFGGVETVADFWKALDVAKLLFRCDVEAELAEEDVRAPLNSAVLKRTTTPGSDKATVAIDTKELFGCAMQLANTYLDEGHFKDAEALLLKLGALFPRTPLIDYNLACAASCLGNAERAIFHLENAVTNGYADGVAIQTEDELLLIREDPRVVQMINQLNGFGKVPAGAGPTSRGEAVLGSMFDEAKAAGYSVAAVGTKRMAERNEARLAPAAAATSGEGFPVTTGTHGNSRKQNIRNLGAMFPELGQGVAAGLLKKYNGDMNAAVEELLRTKQ